MVVVPYGIRQRPSWKANLSKLADTSFASNISKCLYLHVCTHMCVFHNEFFNASRSTNHGHIFVWYFQLPKSLRWVVSSKCQSHPPFGPDNIPAFMFGIHSFVYREGPEKANCGPWCLRKARRMVDYEFQWWSVGRLIMDLELRSMMHGLYNCTEDSSSCRTTDWWLWAPIMSCRRTDLGLYGPF